MSLEVPFALVFSGIPNEIVHMLFGPVVGSVFAGVMDILKYLIKPTGAFFPGFYFDRHACRPDLWKFYYKKELSLWRVLAAHVVVAIICNVILNTWVPVYSLWKGIFSTSSGEISKECHYVSY